MTVINYIKQGDVRVLVIGQARLLDDSVFRELQKEILDFVKTTDEKKLVFDFGLVQLMSSAGLGMLVRAKKRCAERDISLRICGLAPTVAEVIRITGVDQLFEIHDDAEEAVAAFREGDPDDA
jgi:anti-anti-sigma factor